MGPLRASSAIRFPNNISIMKVVFLFALVLVCVAASPKPRVQRLVKPKNDLTCSLCTDIVTDIDDFLTSDTTEDQIVSFVNGLCNALGYLLPDLGQACTDLIASQLPGIIDNLVNNNMDPATVCET